MPLTKINYNQIKGAVLNLLDYGADNTGTSDVSAQLQLAITAAAAAGKTLFVPTGIYKLTLPVVSTVMCSIVGEGGQSGDTVKGSIFKWAGAAAATAITFNISQQYTDLTFANFTIMDDSGVAGTAATYIKIVTVVSGASAFYRCLFHKLVLSGCSSYAMIWDNTINLTVANDGFFLNQIKECVIQNGFQAIQLGDSVAIENCSFASTSTTVGNTVCGIVVTQASGAAELRIVGNNITSGGGAISLTNAIQARMYDNQIEYPSAYTYAGAANTGLITLTGCTDCTIQNNNLNPQAALCISVNYCITLAGATVGTHIRGNSFTMGELAHIQFTGTANANVIGYNSYTPNELLSYSAAAPETYYQVGVMIPLTTFLNSWAPVANNGHSGVQLLLGENGIAYLFGQLNSGAGAAIFTLASTLVSVVNNLTTTGVSAAGAVDSTAGGVIQIASGAGQQPSVLSAVAAATIMLDGFWFRYTLKRN
jgi:hypothetical protein